jgi:hypothetical protein
MALHRVRRCRSPDWNERSERKSGAERAASAEPGFRHSVSKTRVNALRLNPGYETTFCLNSPPRNSTKARTFFDWCRLFW